MICQLAHNRQLLYKPCPPFLCYVFHLPLASSKMLALIAALESQFHASVTLFPNQCLPIPSLNPKLACYNHVYEFYFHCIFFWHEPPLLIFLHHLHTKILLLLNLHLSRECIVCRFNLSSEKVFCHYRKISNIIIQSS